MINFPKCGELNGNGREKCWKCATELPETQQKICPNCKQISDGEETVCSACGTPLANYSPEHHQKELSREGTKSYFWLKLLAFFLPVAGLVLGIVYIAQKEQSLGKSLLIYAAIGFLLSLILALAGIQFGCSCSVIIR